MSSTLFEAVEDVVKYILRTAKLLYYRVKLLILLFNREWFRPLRGSRRLLLLIMVRLNRNTSPVGVLLHMLST